MSRVVKINSTDESSKIVGDSVTVEQSINNKAWTASFLYRKYGSRTLEPAFDDDVEIYDGSDKIFGGKIVRTQQYVETGAGGYAVLVQCAGHAWELDKRLASRTYEGDTVADIVSDLVSSYASGFSAAGVTSTFVIEKAVFNQIPISQCLDRLVKYVSGDWYIDVNKVIYIVQKYDVEAPFDLTDTNGKYDYRTLRLHRDGTQVVNRVKVRGGEYEQANTYENIITVRGNDTKSFPIGYRMTNLAVELDTGGGFSSQTVLPDYLNDFTSADVLHDFQSQTVRFENALSDGDRVKITGNRKVRVLAVAEEPASIAAYNYIEKLIREDDIQSNTIARRRAAAELYSYSAEIADARFVTKEPGLRAGQVINVQSDIRNIDEDVIIKTLRFRALDPDTFIYEVEAISTKRIEFLDLLKKIVQAQPLDIDEQETSEEIFTDTQNINIVADEQVVNPVEDDQTQQTDENYEIDPFGAGTDATYVVAPYTPSSQFDTKREGRVDISMQAY